MLFEAESWEMNTSAEHTGLGQNANTTNAIQLHLHVRVAEGITEVGEMRSPCRILRITLNNNSILVECICQRESCLRLLPGVQIVRLLSTQPIRQRAPHI